MDVKKTRAFVDQVWDDTIIPTLQEYITIPNQSPVFDTEWEKNGLLDQAVDLAADWVRARAVDGLEMEIVRLPVPKSASTLRISSS